MKCTLGKNGYWPAILLGAICLTLCGSVQAEFVADDVKLVPLTDDGKSTALAWAYHGDLIAVIREISNNQKQLLIMKSDGSGEQTITPIGNPFFAEWSWKGDKLSYEFSNTPDDGSQGQIYVYDVKTRESVAVSAPYPFNDLSYTDGPFWSPDDKHVAYKVRAGVSRNTQVWIAETDSGRRWRILAGRGEAKELRWSFTMPPRLCLLVEAAGEWYDVATVRPDGADLNLITNIGAQSIWMDTPRWSPTDDWVAYKDSIDMTQTERDRKHEDCWIARPDGSGKRNLTNAATPVTEEQLDIYEIRWSWDGRWIMLTGFRFDKQGNQIGTLYLADPVNGGYWPILTSYPRKTGELDIFRTVKWSYDSSKIAILNYRNRVKNWGPDNQFEKPRWILSLYDVRTKKLHELIALDEELDHKRILGHYERNVPADISWSPDNRSLLVTIATVVSRGNNILQPDVYRVDLPERFIDPSAAEHIGPPVGRENTGSYEVRTADKPPAPDPQSTAKPRVPAPQPGDKINTAHVTELVRPMHMTVEEAVASLSPDYGHYFTVNTARNIMLFKGPADVLASLRSDLKLIDTLAPHILVDLLAVELTEEANRDLGLDWTYVQGHVALFQPSGRPLRGLDDRGFPAGALGDLTTLPAVGQSFYQGIGTLPREFLVRLNSLIKDGEATILANPRTVSMSGKKSLIQIRKTLNYFFNEGFDTSGRPVVKKSDIASDTIGRITPTLLPDGRIHLVVDVDVGSFTFTQAAGLPEQTGRKSTTEVVVQEGQTIVIGGLRQQEMSHSETKVPLLSDLPLVGPLFQRSEQDLRNSVLTIFITPQILRPENPVPEWPKLNGQDHKLVPIMEHEPPGAPGLEKGNDIDVQGALDRLLKLVQ